MSSAVVPTALTGSGARDGLCHSNLEHSLPVQYLLPLSYLEILGALFGGGEGRGWSAECEQN